MNLSTLIYGSIGRVCEILYRYSWTSPEMTSPSRISLESLEHFFGQVGIRDGSTVFVHSSWNNLASGKFTGMQLIDFLIDHVGKEGTLVMPAFPPSKLQVSSTVFDVRKTPSAAGLVTESFRRYPGVLRSINLNHSVCAFGLRAEFLTRDHHLSETSWDSRSPYHRLRGIDDAWIVGLGVGHRLNVATALHCADSALFTESRYFSKLFKERMTYNFKKADGELGQHTYIRRYGQMYTPRLAKYFTSEELIEDCIDGLEVYAIRARTLIDKTIALGREGKTMYVWPVPWPWYFKSN